MNHSRDFLFGYILSEESAPVDSMSSPPPPFNHSMHQSAFNTSYRKRRAPQRFEHELVYSSDEDYDSEYDRRSDRSETPERERRRSYAADGTRDMPHRRQYTTHDRYAPRGVYDPSADRAPHNDTSLARYHSHTSSSYQNDGNLVPHSTTRRGSDADYYNDRRRDSAASHSSRHSHKSHRSSISHRSSTSGRSDRDKYDRDGRRRTHHHRERKPTMGDSVMLLVNSVKGAFDKRK